MMVDVLASIEGGQRERRERWRKRTAAHVVPKHPGPLYVVITVKVAAAYCLSRILQQPENQGDGNGPGQQIGRPHGRVGFDPVSDAGLSGGFTIDLGFLNF